MNVHNIAQLTFARRIEPAHDIVKAAVTARLTAAVRSGLQKNELEARLDEALREIFPASDPIAVTLESSRPIR